MVLTSRKTQNKLQFIWSKVTCPVGLHTDDHPFHAPLRASELFSFLFQRCSNHSAPFLNQGPFEFRHGAHDLEHQPDQMPGVAETFLRLNSGAPASSCNYFNVFPL